MIRLIHRPLILLVLLSFSMMISCAENKYPDPLTVEEAIKSFQLHEDFDIEIFASEPHVIDPVEMVFDERGNAYVIEMRDYPFKDRDLSDDEVVGEISQYPYHPEALETKGLIRQLIDSNGDGRIDSSTVFAEGIREGTSILPWNGGLLVTSAPNILYLKDTNDDSKADTREVLFTGFSTSNIQAQITSLKFGIDNWIYASNAGRPGEITFERNPKASPISVRGTDFRFRLDTGEFEQATGSGRFGRTINDWGHRFMLETKLHIRQSVIPYRYLNRHSHMPTVSAIENINDHGRSVFQLTPATYWRTELQTRKQRQFDQADIDETADPPIGVFTGATGSTLYTGQAFSDEYYGNIFTGEVAANLVHRDVLSKREDSPVYIASRDETEKNREFLASTDSWFRPTTFTVGPDGYLYVIDMYRQHIEHPVSVPEDLKMNPDMDYTQGLEYGRIYRIRPKNINSSGNSFTNNSANLKEMVPEEWVKLLSHPSQWWRLTAQRLLLEQQDISVVPAIINILTSHENPKARLHALYVLEGLNSLNAEIVEKAMDDPHPGVREHGMILSERYPELLSKLLTGATDPSIYVAFQATLSIGEFEGERVVKTLADVVKEYGYDPWFRIAIVSSKAGSSVELLKKMKDRGFFQKNISSWKLSIFKDLTFAVGSRGLAEEVIFVLDSIQMELNQDETWQIAGLNGLTKGLEKHEESNSDLKEALQKMNELSSAERISADNINERISILRKVIDSI